MPEYRHIANLSGPRGLNASEIPGLSYGNPIQLTDDDVVDEITEPGIYVCALGSRARLLGLPDGLPGQLEVLRTGVTSLRNHRWTTRRGVWVRGSTDAGESWSEWETDVRSDTVSGIVASERDDAALEDGQMLFVYEPLLDEYEVDFSRGLSDWVLRWEDAQDSWRTVGGSGSGGSTALLTDRDASGSRRALITWETPPQLKNCEVVFRGRHSGAFGSTRAAVALRASGIEGEETAIVVGHRVSNDNVVIIAATYNAGSFRTTITHETSIPYALGDWYWTRVRLEGRNLDVKLWPDGEEEPSEWTASNELMSSEDFPAGRVGCFIAASGTSRWDSLTISPVN